MRWRFVKPNERVRCMIRCNRAHDLVGMEERMEALGYMRVRFLTFIKHILRPTGKFKSYYLPRREKDQGPPASL